MHPIEFPGSVEIKKPNTMTDEECSSAWATAGIDGDGFPYYMTCWKPNYEDMKAIIEGRPVYVKTIGKQLPPMALFTLDENNKGNF
jgi:hypothetical protein